MSLIGLSVIRKCRGVLQCALTILVLFCSVSALSDSELDQKLNLGRSLEQRGRTQEALRIYEDLLSRYPDDLRLYESLRRIYRQTRDHAKWIRLAEDQLERYPNHPKFIESLTEAYLRAGEREKAITAGEKIFEVKSSKAEDYNMIGALFLTHRIPEEAIRIYLHARKVFGDDDLFAPILANAYRIARDDRGQAEEYIRMLKGNAGERQQAETGLQQILRKGDPKMLRSVLEESLQREPQRNELHLFLGDLHLREGRYEDALKSYERGDQEDPLYSLARRAEEEGRYEIALRSYETLAERGKPIALYRKGVTLRKMGKEEEAIVSFQSLIEKYPNQEERLVGLYSLGMIYLENHQDPEKAISYFEEFLAQKPKVGEEVLEAKFGIVECHLMKGDFKKAEKGLLDLRETPSGDRALFCLGELYFFQEDFETASEKFNQVVERYPKSRFENDALRKILLIADYREVEGLKSLASVELMGRQGRFREGIDELKRVLNLEGGVNHRGVHTSPEPHVVQGGMSQMAQSAIGKKGLMDDALLLMGDLYEGMGDYPSAIRSYEDLVERNKESPLASEALRRAGEVFFRRLGDRKRAVETFERVLLEYPNSVQTDLIRKRVEELREEL